MKHFATFWFLFQFWLSSDATHSNYSCNFHLTAAGGLCRGWTAKLFSCVRWAVGFISTDCTGPVEQRRFSSVYAGTRWSSLCSHILSFVRPSRWPERSLRSGGATPQSRQNSMWQWWFARFEFRPFFAQPPFCNHCFEESRQEERSFCDPAGST